MKNNRVAALLDISRKQRVSQRKAFASQYGESSLAVGELDAEIAEIALIQAKLNANGGAEFLPEPDKPSAESARK